MPGWNKEWWSDAAGSLISWFLWINPGRGCQEHTQIINLKSAKHHKESRLFAKFGVNH